MATRQQVFNYVNEELARIAQKKYTTEEAHLAVRYQLGLLQAIVTDLCLNDTANLNHFKRIIKRLS